MLSALVSLRLRAFLHQRMPKDLNALTAAAPYPVPAETRAVPSEATGARRAVTSTLLTRELKLQSSALFEVLRWSRPGTFGLNAFGIFVQRNMRMD